MWQNSKKIISTKQVFITAALSYCNVRKLPYHFPYQNATGLPAPYDLVLGNPTNWWGCPEQGHNQVGGF